MVTIHVPKEVLAWAVKVAPLMSNENKGDKTKDGGKFRDVKGCLGQWAVDQYLNKVDWEHIYSKPYVPMQHGDFYDVLFPSGDIWDVKCRSWTDEIIRYRTLLMGKHEKEGKKCDYYVFCTVDRDFGNVHILGAKKWEATWNEIIPLSKEVEEKMLFPTEGKVSVDSLVPLTCAYMHC